MQQFVQGAGSYVSEMADAVLNGLTNGRHGKFTETCRAVQLTEKEKRKEEEEEEEEEGGEGEGDGDGGGEEAGEDKPFRALAVKEEDEAMEVQLEGESASPLMKQSAVGVSAGVRAAAILSPLAELDSHVPAGRETPFLALPDVEALSGGAVMRHGLLDDGGVASGSASPVAVSNLQSSVSGSGSGSKVTSRESSVASGRGEVGGGGGGGGEEGWETRLDRAPEVSVCVCVRACMCACAKEGGREREIEGLFFRGGNSIHRYRKVCCSVCGWSRGQCLFTGHGDGSHGLGPHWRHCSWCLVAWVCGLDG